jgi:tetratricopeptide (TPR) repeat protein
MGWAFLEKGNFDDAENNLLKSVEICERFNFAALYSGAEYCLGEVYYFNEKYKMSKEHKANALRILNNKNFMPSFAYVNELSYLRAMVKNQEKIQNFDIFISYPKKCNVKLYEGRIRRHLAEIFLYLDASHLEEAERWIIDAINFDKQNKLFYEIAHDFLVYGEIYLKKDEIAKANQFFSDAIKVFKDCGADCWAIKLEKVIK